MGSRGAHKSRGLNGKRIELQKSGRKLRVLHPSTCGPAMSKMGQCLASLGHVPMRTGIVGLGTDVTAQPSASAWGWAKGRRTSVRPSCGTGVTVSSPMKRTVSVAGHGEGPQLHRSGPSWAPGRWTDPENRPPQRAPPRGDGEAGDNAQRVRPSCLTNPGAPCAPNKRGSTRAVWPRETPFRADAPLLRAFSSQSFYQKMTPARMGKRPPAELSRT